MLGARLATGITLVAAFLAFLWLDEYFAPWFPCWLLTAVVVVSLGAWELADLLSATSASPCRSIVLGGSLALVVANWAPHVTEWFGRGLPATHDPSSPVNVMAWPLWTFVMIVMFTFVFQSSRYRGPGASMATISGTVLAVAYLGLLGGFVLQTRWLDGKYHGLIPLVALVATAKGGDVGAYTLGRLAGRHKLWPVLSPNKTVEGSAGGLFFGVAASLIVNGVSRFLLGGEHLPWWSAVLYGLLVGASAQIGDLMESMIKRDCARKDASQTLPGFGGVLDVLDSLLFAGPVAYGYWIWLGP